MKFCSHFRRFLFHNYCNQDLLIKQNGAFSNNFTVSNGVDQGAVLSPLLFNVYLEELLLHRNPKFNL